MRLIANLTIVMTLLAATITIFIYFSGSPYFSGLHATPDPAVAVPTEASKRNAVVPAPDPGAADPARASERITVASFYRALSNADGLDAERFVIPEKRGKGPYAAAGINSFYGSLSSPLQVSEITPLGGGTFRVSYHYSTAAGRNCGGSATVSTVMRNSESLIDYIQAKDSC